MIEVQVGDTVIEFPDNTPMETIQQKSQEFAAQSGLIDQPQAEGPPVRTVDALTRAALDRVAGNLLSIPSIAEGLGRQGLQSLGLDVSSETAIPRGSVAPVRAVGQMGESALERIKEGDIPGAFQAATSFGPALEQVEAEGQRVRQEAPGATQVGEVAGDLSTLMLAGSPLIRGAGRGVVRGAGVAGRAGAQSFPRISRALQAARSRPGTVRVIDDALKSQFSRRIGTGAVKAAEAGLEGSILSLLDEGDPTTGALVGAGLQAGGSLSREVLRRGFSKGPLAGLGAATAIIFLAQPFIPGGRNFILEATEGARDKMALSLVAGLFLGSLTGRSIPNKGFINRNYPTVAREIRTFFRGGLTDYVKEIFENRESGNLVPERVLTRMIHDPGFFSLGAMKKISESIRAGRKLTPTIERLIRNDTAFRLRLEELDPVPVGPEIPAPTGPTPTGRPPQFPMLVP